MLQPETIAQVKTGCPMEITVTAGAHGRGSRTLELEFVLSSEDHGKL